MSVKIISMDARGMTTREIQGHLRDLYGIDASPDWVPDAVLEEGGGEAASGGALYPLIFFEAIRVKVRDEVTVRNKAVYLTLGQMAPRRSLDRAERGRQVLA